MKKLRVGVIFGGRSGEHEVSVASAAAVFKHLDRTRYDPVAIRIEKDGRWTLPDRPPTVLAAADVIEQGRLAAAHPVRPGREAHLVAYPTDESLITIDRRADKGDDGARVTGLGLDVVFPVLHGPFGEDGTVQGLLELANVAYVGAGVLASAVGMDKAFMKLAFAARGLPVAEYRVLRTPEWRTDRVRLIAAIQSTLGFPVFVKPANLGSSVGISKAKTPGELATAIDLAFEFDLKVVVEAAVPAARELEVGVLGNDQVEASVAGEVVPGREFYDYEAKYLDSGSIGAHSGGARRRAAGGRPPDGRRGVPGRRWRRHGAGRFPAVARDRHALRQRGQYHSRVHDDQHVRQAVGRHGRRLSGSARSSDPARARASRRETAPEDERAVSLARHAGAAAMAGALLAAPDARSQGHALTGGDRLAAVYAQILNTRFDRAEETLAGACAPAPREACQVLDATTTWWRILINPDDTGLDDDFQQRVAAAIAATERWTEREPRSAEAWFYLGAAYGARVSWRVQRKEHLAAARDGKRIKEALERALALDPGLSDARFGIGLYKYYAAIAPAVARFFRFLFLLPGGDREEGLSDMEAVHARGVLLRGEADYQLHWIYLWYENQPQRALELLRALRARSTRQTRISSSGPPTPRTATCTTTPRA